MALSLTSTPAAETVPVGVSTLIGKIQIQFGPMAAAGVIGALADHHLRHRWCSDTSCGGSRSARSSDRAPAHHRTGSGRVPRGSASRTRRPGGAAVCRSARDLRPRQRRRHRPGSPAARRPALRAAPKRAGDGAHGRRLRQAHEPPADLGVHVVDRAGRHQHGHRARRWRPSIGCRCCCCPGTSLRPGGSIPRSSSWSSPAARGISVNDAFRPVSRFFDRIDRPEQLAASLLEAVRVLTDQAETGAVTIALPQDVQAEAATSPSSCSRRACGGSPGRFPTAGRSRPPRRSARGADAP